MRFLLCALAVLLAVPLAAPSAGAQTGGVYDLHWNLLAGGGETFATAGAYRMASTVSQDAAGTAAGDAYVLSGGLWTPPAAPNVAVEADAAPLEFTARVEGPNPFGASTAVRFDLPAAARVTLRLYGVDGRLVRELADASFEAGRHVAFWDGHDRAGAVVPPGIYFARIRTGDAHATLRLVRLR